jgi:hypothetical protein
MSLGDALSYAISSISSYFLLVAFSESTALGRSRILLRGGLCGNERSVEEESLLSRCRTCAMSLCVSLAPNDYALYGMLMM